MQRRRKTPARSPASRGGEALAQWRKSMRFSQEEAATFLRVSRQNYVRWEAGEREPEPIRWFLIDDATRGAVPWHAWTASTAADLIDSVVRRYPQRHGSTSIEQTDQRLQDPTGE